MEVSRKLKESTNTHVHLNQDPPDSEMEDSAEQRRREGPGERLSLQEKVAIIKI